ncbi:rhodanese-like domain-containing protein [Celerinatantimonas yamalensis]|uniref:Rhodanese-like domain-containing protein n=1 Tax=Celerinatantimonas yamalensis TaxID=559956 RepID=A0ABW9G8T3_9GAMM
MQQIIEFVHLHPMLCLMWGVLLVAVVYSYLLPLISGVKGVPYQQVTQLINRHDAVVLDIRPAEQYRKGHIAGAVNAPQSQLKADQLSAYDKYREQPLVVVCDMGNKASSVARTFTKAGFKEVYYLQGGMGAWTGANLPLVKK